jgi:hypothetical protein
MDIKDMLGQEQKSITSTPRLAPKASLFRKSLTLTYVCKLFRHEFRPQYLERVPFHIVTRCFMAFLDIFIAPGNTRSLTAPPQNTRATIFLHRAQRDDRVFVDIKFLVLLVRRFPNIACTLARDELLSLSQKQTNNRFLEEFIQIKEFRLELLSALEHDIASIHRQYEGKTEFHVIFTKNCTRRWMNKIPRGGRVISTKPQGGLRDYIRKLGLAGFGLGHCGLETFSIVRWKPHVRVSKETRTKSLDGSQKMKVGE